MLAINNEVLHIEFDARGAAIDKLIYLPLARNVARSCEERSKPHHYCGTIVGPIANRIARGQFSIGDETFQVDQNEAHNTLHGGRLGLSELDWEVADIEKTQISFAITLEDQHMGFPGPAHFYTKYALEKDTLAITLKAQSARPNYFNLTSHLYFNLDGSASIDGHKLFIDSEKILLTDAQKIPIFPPTTVQGTGFDSRKERTIGRRKLDHNFCFPSNNLAPMGVLSGATGLKLEFSSNQRGLQVYTADHLHRSHLALEPQDWPNAINQPEPNIDYHFINMSRWKFSY